MSYLDKIDASFRKWYGLKDNSKIHCLILVTFINKSKIVLEDKVAKALTTQPVLLMAYKHEVISTPREKFLATVCIGYDMEEYVFTF